MKKINFTYRIETLRNDIIDSIRLLLHSHGLNEIVFSKEQDDPVWIIWFNKSNDPSECRVSGIKITDNSLTVIAHEKETDIEVECHYPYELGAKNIDWLQQMYEAVWQQLNDNDNNNDNN